MVSVKPQFSCLRYLGVDTDRIYYTSDGGGAFTFGVKHFMSPLSPSPPSVCICNLRLVSSSTTPPSVGLQLVKQKHLIAAEATQSYMCMCVAVISKLPGLCPLH